MILFRNLNRGSLSRKVICYISTLDIYPFHHAIFELYSIPPSYLCYLYLLPDPVHISHICILDINPPTILKILSIIFLYFRPHQSYYNVKIQLPALYCRCFRLSLIFFYIIILLFSGKRGGYSLIIKHVWNNFLKKI